MGQRVLALLEYALRLAFFAWAPFAIVLLGGLVPMTSAIINVALALAAFFLSELLVAQVMKRPWLLRVVGTQLAFEAYYAEKPPAPFLYYVFYPLLFPYWLVNKRARDEFLLFKGYTLMTVVFAGFGGAWRYFTIYKPDLAFKDFWAPFLIGVGVESLAVMMLIMPLATSVVALHKKKQHWSLVALFGVGVVSVCIAAGVMANRHRTFPTLETRARVAARYAAKPRVAESVMGAALASAWSERKRHAAYEREDDGVMGGEPVDKARATLEKFFKPDEAAAFEIWTTARADKTPLMVLYAEGRGKRHAVWLGMKRDGTLIRKVQDVPDGARKAMRTVGDL